MLQAPPKAAAIVFLQVAPTDVLGVWELALDDAGLIKEVWLLRQLTAAEKLRLVRSLVDPLVANALC